MNFSFIQVWVSWLGWVIYIALVCLYVTSIALLSIFIFILPPISYVVASIFSAISSLTLGGLGLGDNSSKYNSQFELNPSESIAHSLMLGLVGIIEFVFNLVFIVPLKFFLNHYIDMPMETPMTEVPGYVAQSINHLRPPHPFSFYCGAASLVFLVVLIVQKALQ